MEIYEIDSEGTENEETKMHEIDYMNEIQKRKISDNNEDNAKMLSSGNYDSSYSLILTGSSVSKRTELAAETAIKDKPQMLETFSECSSLDKTTKLVSNLCSDDLDKVSKFSYELAGNDGESLEKTATFSFEENTDSPNLSNEDSLSCKSENVSMNKDFKKYKVCFNKVTDNKDEKVEKIPMDLCIEKTKSLLKTEKELLPCVSEVSADTVEDFSSNCTKNTLTFGSIPSLNSKVKQILKESSCKKDTLTQSISIELKDKDIAPVTNVMDFDSSLVHATCKNSYVKTAKSCINSAENSFAETTNEVARINDIDWAGLGVTCCSGCGFITTNSDLFEEHTSSCQRHDKNSDREESTESDNQSLKEYSSEKLFEQLNPESTSDFQLSEKPPNSVSSSNKLLRVETVISYSDGLFSCKICNFTGTLTLFENHMLHHVECNPYECAHCKLKFGSLDALKEHSDIVHPQAEFMKNIVGANVVSRLVAQVMKSGSQKATFYEIINRKANSIINENITSVVDTKHFHSLASPSSLSKQEITLETKACESFDSYSPGSKPEECVLDKASASTDQENKVSKAKVEFTYIGAEFFCLSCMKKSKDEDKFREHVSWHFPKLKSNCNECLKDLCNCATVQTIMETVKSQIPATDTGDVLLQVADKKTGTLSGRNLEVAFASLDSEEKIQMKQSENKHLVDPPDNVEKTQKNSNESSVAEGLEYSYMSDNKEMIFPILSEGDTEKLLEESSKERKQDCLEDKGVGSSQENTDLESKLDDDGDDDVVKKKSICLDEILVDEEQSKVAEQNQTLTISLKDLESNDVIVIEETPANREEELVTKKKSDTISNFTPANLDIHKEKSSFECDLKISSSYSLRPLDKFMISSGNSQTNPGENANETCEKISETIIPASAVNVDTGTSSLILKENHPYISIDITESRTGSFYVCGFTGCQFSSINSTQFKNHLEYFHRSVENYPCAHCGHKNSSEDGLLRHMLNHTNTKVFLLYRCAFRNCRFGTNLLQEFKDHNEILHRSEQNYRCVYCNKLFSSLNDLLTHLQNNLLKFIQCPHCSAKDRNRKMVLKHISEVHPGKPKQIVVTSQVVCKEKQDGCYSDSNVSVQLAESRKDADRKNEADDVEYLCTKVGGGNVKTTSGPLEATKSTPTSSVITKINSQPCITDTRQKNMNIPTVCPRDSTGNFFLFTCQWCNFSTNQPRLIQQHVNSQHPERTSRISLEEERNRNLDAKRRSLVNSSDMKYKGENSLRSSNDLQSDSLAKACCPCCPATYKHLVQLKHHVKMKHPGCQSLQLYKCVHCNAKATSKTYLIKSCQNKHPMKEFHVTQIREVLALENGLNTVGVQLSSNTYFCKTCSFTSSSRNIFDAHQLQHAAQGKSFPVNDATNKRNFVMRVYRNMVNTKSRPTQPISLKNVNTENRKLKSGNLIGRNLKNFANDGNYSTNTIQNGEEIFILGSIQLDAKLHVLYTTEGKWKRCKCCKFNTDTLFTVHHHLLTYHLNIYFWHCIYCHMRSIIKQDIIQHCVEFHKDKKPVVQALEQPNWERCIQFALNQAIRPSTSAPSLYSNPNSFTQLNKFISPQQILKVPKPTEIFQEKLNQNHSRLTARKTFRSTLDAFSSGMQFAPKVRSKTNSFGDKPTALRLSNGMFKCSVCSAKGFNEWQIRKHIDLEHNENSSDSQECMIVNIESGHNKRVQNAGFDCSSQDSEDMNLETQCNSPLSAMDEQMKEVGKKVIEVVPGILKCPFCSYTSHLRTCVKCHIWTQHMLLKRKKCPHCSFVSWFDRGIHSHITIEHSNLCPDSQLLKSGYTVLVEEPDGTWRETKVNIPNESQIELSKRNQKKRVSNELNPEPALKRLKYFSDSFSPTTSQLTQQRNSGSAPFARSRPPELQNAPLPGSSSQILGNSAEDSDLMIISDSKPDDICVKMFDAALKTDVFMCTICSYKTTNKTTFNSHTYNHKPAVYKCGYCPFQSNPRCRVAAHIRKYHNAPINIIHLKDLAGRQVDLASNKQKRWPVSKNHTVLSASRGQESEKLGPSELQQPKLPTINDKPHQLKYCCHLCVFKTNDIDRFAKHTSLHNFFTRGMKIDCMDCSYSTNKISEYENHINSHLTSYLFSCGYCSFSSMEELKVKNHSLQIHPDLIFSIEISPGLKKSQIATKWSPANFNGALKLTDFLTMDCDEFYKLISSYGVNMVDLKTKAQPDSDNVEIPSEREETDKFDLQVDESLIEFASALWST